MKPQFPTIEPERIELAPGSSLALVLSSPGALPEDMKHAAWAMLRSLLARFISCPPGALRFGRSPQGKPGVIGAGAPAFNLSHSRGRSLIALSWSGDVGCDIEDRFSDEDVMGLCPSVLHASELDAMERLAPRERQDAFRRYWVRKEAVLKAEGSGFLRDPRDVITGLEARNPEWTAQAGPRFVLHNQLIAEGCFAAVASMDADCRWLLLEG